jgi:hypothetical protein
MVRTWTVYHMNKMQEDPISNMYNLLYSIMFIWTYEELKKYSLKLESHY